MEKVNISHLEGIPWEELDEEDKRKFIKREAEMRKIFSREHKCLKLSNMRVTDSKFNAHITLPKALSQDKEVYINLRRETFTKTMKRYLKKYELNKIKMNMTKKQVRGYKKLKKRLKRNEFKMCQTDKSNHLAMIANEKYNEMGEEHTSKDRKITLEKAMELAKINDQHTSMMLKIFNMGRNMKEKKRFRESYMKHGNISHKEDLYKDHKKGYKTRPVINGSGSFSAGGGELYSLILSGIAALKDGKKSVSSTEEMMRTLEDINEMVKENNWKIYKESEDAAFRKYLEENPDTDPPIIMIATDAVALYPSLEKHETARKIRRFIEKSEVTFEDVNISEALVYLKLNEATLRKQGSLNEVRGFLPIPKNGIDKHMTHPTVKGPHTASELKEMDDESNGERKNDKNPWILRDEPKDPQIIREIMGRVMEVNTISLFGNFAYEFKGEIYHQQMGGPTGTQSATIAALISMEETLDEVEEQAEKSKPTVHNIGDRVYVDDGRGWWFLFRPGTRYEDGRFVIKTDKSSLQEDSKITLGELTRREILKCLNDKNKNITFTVEKPDDYKEDNGNIPTLDFKIGINDDNTEYIMMFYEKPMASKYFTPADSAIGRVQRNQIVANDITRMLRRMSPKLVIKESKELVRVLDNANNRLKYSGYNYYERLHII